MKGRRFGPLTALLGTAVTCLVALHHLGGAVPGPPSWTGHEVLAWASHTNPVLVAIAAVRLVALAVGYQLVASAGLATVGSLAHAPALLRASDLVALPGVRALVRHAAAATLSASTLLASPVLPAPAGTATLRVVPSGPMVTLSVDPPVPGSEVTLAVVPSSSDAPSAPVAPPEAPDPAQGAASWTVQRGDHLWSIAERALARQWGRAPSEREVDRYWRAVMTANTNLADPDLIFVGQQVALPPVGIAPVPAP